MDTGSLIEAFYEEKLEEQVCKLQFDIMLLKD